MRKMFILFLAFALAIGAASAQTPAELLEQGIQKQDVAGDHAAAMVIYRKIVDNEKAPGKLAAEATLRLGQCAHRLGEFSE